MYLDIYMPWAFDMDADEKDFLLHRMAGGYHPTLRF